LINVLNTHLYAQTITLFRYFMLGIVNRRLFGLLGILLLVAFLASGFVFELAIINSAQIASALMGDFLRYSFVLLALLMIVSNVAEDFESKQFGRLFTMPIARWQYIFAQILLIGCVAFILSIATLIVLLPGISFELALYWSTALCMEIFLVGLLGLIAILSLEKIPQAVFFTLAIYLLAKLSELIRQMLSYAVEYSDSSAANQFAEAIFNFILNIIPRLDAFAQNDLFFKSTGLLEALILQSQTVAVYAIFLITVSLVDFYRKEINQ